MNLFTDPRLKNAGLLGGTAPRTCGNMADLRNQNALYTQLGITPENIVHFHQIHSAKIVTITCEKEARRLSPLTDADAWVFSPTVSGLGASILTADCTPLFVWNEDGSAWALAHCGWRGVVQNLPYKTVQTLQQTGAKGPFYAWAGPHIEACCFEVQEDVSSQFPATCLEIRNDKKYINLNTEIRAQLQQGGLKSEDILFDGHCTCCNENHFFSWRRDHVRNLLLSFIYKL